MANGVNKKRLERCKKISIKAYLLETHPDMFRFGKNKFTLILKDNPDYVVYSDHAYNFGDNVSHPRRDNIDVLNDLFGYGFISAVEELEMWARKHNLIDDASTTSEEETVQDSEINLDMFDNIFSNVPDSDESLPFSGR